MATLVYIWPSTVMATKMLYGDPNRILATRQFDGAPGQRSEQPPRSLLTVEGKIWNAVAPDFDNLMDRISGGVHFIAFINLGMRAQFGWDMDAALNSSGAEFWRADGNTSIYAGEADNAPTGPWRTVDSLAAGGEAAAATSIAVDGLLGSEVIPKGSMIRIGDYRHRVLADATADGAGAATITLARPLRAIVANNDPVTIPGDFFVGSLGGPPQVSAHDNRGDRTYKITFNEVYSDEVTGGFTYVVD